MASTDAFYLKHDLDAREDDRMRPLIMKLGASGYGVYWWIIEDLYRNKGRIARDYPALAWAYRVPENIVKSVIEDFGAFYDAEGRIACARVDRDLAARKEMAELGRGSISRRKRPDGTPWVKHPDRDLEASYNDPYTRRGEERTGEKGEEGDLTAANGSPSAAELSKKIDKALEDKDRSLFMARMEDSRLPFDFGDFKRGGRINDLPAETCALVLEKVPRLGLDLRRFLQVKIDEKKADSARRKS